MSDVWRIEPEPTEEELAALTVAVLGLAARTSETEPEPEPDSAWLRSARREAVDRLSGPGGRWGERG